MALTPSKMIPLGTLAPDFALFDVLSKRIIHLEEVRSPFATVVMFICNHCPYVQYIESSLVAFAKNYLAKKVSFVAISANDVEAYPEDSPEEMEKIAVSHRYPFPYLFDETQEVARKYGAACTPDFFVFDASLHLAYRGQFDEARPNKQIPITGQNLGYALDCLLAKKPIEGEQFPSIGCNIKWKSARIAKD